MSVMEFKFISTKDASIRLNVQERRVRQLIKEGKLKANKYGRDLWVEPESLEEYIRWLNYWKDKKDGGR